MRFNSGENSTFSVIEPLEPRRLLAGHAGSQIVITTVPATASLNISVNTLPDGTVVYSTPSTSSVLVAFNWGTVTNSLATAYATGAINRAFGQISSTGRSFNPAEASNAVNDAGNASDNNNPNPTPTSPEVAANPPKRQISPANAENLVAANSSDANSTIDAPHLSRSARPAGSFVLNPFQTIQQCGLSASNRIKTNVSEPDSKPLQARSDESFHNVISTRNLVAASAAMAGIAAKGLLGKTTIEAGRFGGRDSRVALSDRFPQRQEDFFGQREIESQSLKAADRAGLLEENGQKQAIQAAAAATAARRRKRRRQAEPTPGRRCFACAAAIVIGCALQTIFLLHTTDAYAITLLCVASNVCTLAAVGWSIGISRWLPRRSPEMLVLSVFAGLITAAMAWNMYYHGYTRTLVYRNEIFRRALHRPYTPLYGAPQHFTARGAILCGIGGVALLAGAGVFILASRSRRFAWAMLIAAQLTAIACFAISERPHRLSPDVSGYKEFPSDLSRFSSAADMAKHYIEKMPTLSWLNQHYPPGNMLLFWMERYLGIHGLVKSIVILFALLTSVPLYFLCKELGLSKIAGRSAVVLCACSSAVVIYTTVNTTSLILPLTALFAWAMIRSLRTGSRGAAWVAGMSLVGFWMISFSFILPAALVMLMSVIATAYGLMNWRYVARGWLWCGSCILGVLISLRIIFGLDLLGCLIMGVLDHQLQQRNDPFHPWQSYLFRSTGNILAYLIVVAPLAAFAGALMFRRATKRTLAGTLAAATWTTLLVAGFSGLFWLETERIWVFFTPFLAIGAAYGIAQYDRTHKTSSLWKHSYLRMNRMALVTCLLSAIALVSTYEMIFMPYRP